MNKKIIKILVSMMMVCVIGAPVTYASTNDNNASLNDGRIVSKVFVDICDDYYAEPSNFIVTDKKGNDISMNYYLNTARYYKEGNYAKIHDYAIDVVSEYIMVEPDILKEVPSESKGLKTVYTSGYTYKLQRICSYLSGVPNQTTMESKCVVKGRYVLNYSTGKITSASTTSVTHDYISPGWNWRIHTINSYTNPAVISSDGYSVSFSGGFSVTAQYVDGDYLGTISTYGGYYCSYSRSGD